MNLTMVAAMTSSGVIGKDGRLPWPTIPEDMRRFRALTVGKHIIMGRKTYRSIGRLPLRTNVVLTNNEFLPAPNCITAPSIAVALGLARHAGNNAVVIGGADVFRQFLPLVSRLYLTIIHGDYEGDAYFPDPKIDTSPEWRVYSRETIQPADASLVEFVTLDRVS